MAPVAGALPNLIPVKDRFPAGSGESVFNFVPFVLFGGQPVLTRKRFGRTLGCISQTEAISCIINPGNYGWKKYRLVA
jgi:hypothetical protein